MKKLSYLLISLFIGCSVPTSETINNSGSTSEPPKIYYTGKVRYYMSSRSNTILGEIKGHRNKYSPEHRYCENIGFYSDSNGGLRNPAKVFIDLYLDANDLLTANPYKLIIYVKNNSSHVYEDHCMYPFEVIASKSDIVVTSRSEKSIEFEVNAKVTKLWTESNDIGDGYAKFKVKMYTSNSDPKDFTNEDGDYDIRFTPLRNDIFNQVFPTKWTNSGPTSGQRPGVLVLYKLNKVKYN